MSGDGQMKGGAEQIFTWIGSWMDGCVGGRVEDRKLMCGSLCSPQFAVVEEKLC